MKFINKVLFFLVLLFGGLYLAREYYYQQLNNPLKLDEALFFTIERGQGIKIVSENLEAQGLINAPQKYSFLFYALQNNLARNIKAGVYQLEAGMNIPQLLEILVNAKTVQHKFTLVEGKNFQELRSALQKEKYLQQTLNDKSEEEIAKLLNLETKKLEGLFLADTYFYPHQSSDLELLQRMNNALQKKLDVLWQKRQTNYFLKSPQEALILASLIEKETSLSSERTEIAGVFMRRLQKNMRLQTDPSVIYGLTNYQGRLTLKDLQQDHEYNTYTRNGLPPTPIAMVGSASLEAAFNPKEGNSLFFVANGSGGHTFTDSYEQHLKAVENYRKLKK